MIRVRILKNRGASIVRTTRHGEVKRFVPPDGDMRVDEAAAHLGVTLNRIYRRIEAGTLKANRRGAAWMVRLADVKALATDGL